MARLHPITWLMLFAVAAQLAAEVVFGARETAEYLAGSFSADGVLDWWEGPRLIAYIERDVGATLIGLGYAVTVEICWRVWRRLRAERLLTEGGV